MKLVVSFDCPADQVIELSSLQELHWNKYQEAKRELDQIDFYADRAAYLAASDKVDDEFDALVYALNLDVGEPEDLVDEIELSRW